MHIWRSRCSMHVRVVSVSGEWFALELPDSTTIWDLKSTVRALRGTPRRLQTFLVGERLAGATETLASLRADTIALTLVLSEPACAFCGARNQALGRCSGCNNVYYCGALCQTFAWDRHKFACAHTPATIAESLRRPTAHGPPSATA